MKRNVKKCGLTLGALILALFLVGTIALAPCLVNAEDGEGGPLIHNPSGIRMEGPGEREPVAPSFASPGMDDILFEQPPCTPYDYWNGYESDVDLGYRMFDDFWGLTGDIGDIHWYGFSLDYYYNNCDPMGMEFEIIFYEDAGAHPAAPVAVFSNVIPTITYYDTYDGYYTAYCFEVADLGMPISLTNGWVSIQSIYSPNGCSFFWLTSPAGNWNSVYEYYWDPGYFYYLGDNFAFALTEAEAAPPPNVKYLHAEGGLINMTDPVGTQWHELWPFFCHEYYMSSWNDTGGNGVLSRCDWVDMYEKPDGAVKPYHVEEVTITLNVTPARNHVVDYLSLPLESPQEGAPKSMFIEHEGGYDLSVLTAPNSTRWHEVYPDFCQEYQLITWNDTGNPTSELGYCDYVLLMPQGPYGPLTCPLDEGFSYWPPTDWTRDDWTQNSTNHAGGTSPEALLWSYNIDSDNAYLQSKPVDTTGAPCLTLEFKSYIDDYCCSEGWDYWDPACDDACPSYNCTVYTRAHAGDSWTDVTPWSNPIHGDVGPNTYSIDISSDIGSATQVRFEFEGYDYALDYWYVDDVSLCHPAPTWWHVEDVAVDIVVTPEPPPVGGEAYPVSKASLLAPWIAVAVFLIVGAGAFVLRKRRA